MWQDCPSLIPDSMHFSYIQNAGATALRVASVHGRPEVVAVLIARGATVDYKDEVRHSCMIHIMSGVEERYDDRNMSGWETCQGLQCTLDPCCLYTIVTLAWCSNQVVPCTVYMHTIGYDNNVSPHSSNVTTSTCLYTWYMYIVWPQSCALNTDLNCIVGNFSELYCLSN